MPVIQLHWVPNLNVGTLLSERFEAKKRPVRTVAAIAAEKVIFRGHSLDRALEQIQVAESDRELLQELTNGVLRWYWWLEYIALELLKRPMRSRNRDVLCLLLIGLYQLEFMRIPHYAVVSETVDAVLDLQKKWAGGLINAVLRKFLDARDRFDRNKLPDINRYSHPQWIIDCVRQKWPEDWQVILNANNERPNMVLRINPNCTSIMQYLQMLSREKIEAEADSVASSAVVLKKRVSVSDLPGFEEGLVSVQNQSSQLAVPELDVRPGHRVLDACAAPGGKTIQILEHQPLLGELVALDIDEFRVSNLVSNLSRTSTRAKVMIADAADIQKWWDGRKFDRILLDAPCSTLGVVSKHPDIKHNRQYQDLKGYTNQQSNLLDALLPLLKHDGRLLYTTCSIFSCENEDQIIGALARNPEFKARPLGHHLGRSTGCGRQRLQGVHCGDGFFYAAIERV